MLLNEVQKRNAQLQNQARAIQLQQEQSANKIASRRMRLMRRRIAASVPFEPIIDVAV
jgi:hypothetical protein